MSFTTSKLNRPSHKPEKLSEVEPWIDTTEAASHLKVSKLTLRRWIKSGLLQAKRTPTGDYRFKRSELDSALA